MRILYVHTRDEGGGATRIALDLLGHTARRGHSSMMAVGSKVTSLQDVVEIPKYAPWEIWSSSWSSMRKVLASHNLPGGYVAQHLAQLGTLSYWTQRRRGREDFHSAGTSRLLELVPEEPDIVHAHNLHGNYFDLCHLPRLSRQLPVLLTLHDTWLLSGHCAYSLECARWRSGCGDCPHLDTYPALRRDATAFNWQRKRTIFAESQLYVAAPCRWLIDRVKESMLQPAVIESRIIPNGADLSIFTPGDKGLARSTLGLPRDTFTALFVGEDSYRSSWKDYETIERAIRQLASHPDQPPIHFICLGSKAENRQFGSVTVQFVGYERDQARVAKYYQASDVYLHAAHANADTFPTVILEALACGVPVVATSVCGIPEQIQEGSTGFLVPEHDSPLMVSRIRQLQENENLRLSMGRSAMDSARQRFDVQRMVSDYLGWYGIIVDRWNAAAKSAARVKTTLSIGESDGYC